MRRRARCRGKKRLLEGELRKAVLILQQITEKEEVLYGVKPDWERASGRFLGTKVEHSRNVIFER
jgi:hypothetical protein